ncbi:MAG: DUF6607 family protein [Chitinophagaceae bacterium]
MKKVIGLVAAIGLVISIQAQAPQDKQIVNKLCGCFEVEFKYAETFSPNEDYKFHDREEINGGIELSLPIEVSDRKIIIQHLLVITDSIIVKHWREEWTYENQDIWVYKGDKTWVKEKLSADQVKGKWTQTVWEVSDEPRYQGLSQFVNLDGKLIWQNTTDAPLPRREYSVRSDYNILKRTNRLNISDNGYIHEQDNDKIIRKDGVADKLLVQEKGINSYKKVEDNMCDPAKYYWERYKGYWGKVRKAWADYISTQNTISLKTKVDGKLLHEYLINLSNDYVSKKVSDADIDAKIKGEITKFIGHDDTKSVAQQK